MRQRILIVEDEIICGLYLRGALEKAGHEVVDVVQTGEAAIAAAQDQQPDVIFMDIQLRDEMDGIQAAKTIKASRPAAAIVFISSFNSREILSRAQAVRPAGYFIKPVDPRDLCNFLQKNNPSLEETGTIHGFDLALQNTSISASTFNGHVETFHRKL